MPVHFNLDGRVSVDSVEEAVRFEQLRGTRIKSKKPHQSNKKKGPRLQGWEGFLALLEGPGNATARKVLALVQGASDGMDRHALAKQLETDVQVVTGTITGVAKKAAAAGVDPADVIARDQGGKYRPGRLMAQHGPPMP